MNFKSNEEVAQALVAIRDYLGQWGIASYEGERLINAVDESLTQLKRWMRTDETAKVADGPTPPVLRDVEESIRKTMEHWNGQMAEVLTQFASGVEKQLTGKTAAGKKRSAKKVRRRKSK